MIFMQAQRVLLWLREHGNESEMLFVSTLGLRTRHKMMDWRTQLGSRRLQPKRDEVMREYVPGSVFSLDLTGHAPGFCRRLLALKNYSFAVVQMCRPGMHSSE